MPDVKEGEVEFTVPGTGQKTRTWFRLAGDITPSSIPLVLLHGGPGACSDYMWPLEALTKIYNKPVIAYDQIGNGRSTHLPEKFGDGAFWTEQLFMDELHNLLSKLNITGQFDLLGHSWGGMLGARIATTQPKNLRKLVISNSPASIHLWIDACNALRAQLPPDVEETLKKHEAAGTTDSKEYEEAVLVFYRKHLCRVVPFPQSVQASLDWIAKDGTTYNTMNGPSEFYVIGSLKDWSIIDDLHKIKIPTLVINGEHDEAQDSTVQPYVKMISDVQWHCFPDASHMSHIEHPEAYIKLVGEFLAA